MFFEFIKVNYILCTIIFKNVIKNVLLKLDFVQPTDILFLFFRLSIGTICMISIISDINKERKMHEKK